MSLSKFRGRTQARDGSALHWERADLDGVPYRGAPVLAQSDEEWYARTERDDDVQVKTFRMWEPSEQQALQEVLDGIYNKIYALIDRDKHYDTEHRDWIWHVAWAELHRTARQKPGTLPPPPGASYS